LANNKDSINLNKFISSTGICSRREAEKLITEGRVTINGKPTQLGNRVIDGDEVKIDGNPLRSKPKTLYIALNKPVGIVCTTDTRVEKDNIIDYINYPSRIFPIGRLDKPSEGLILLTNDGDIVNKILRARNNHEKEYLVTVNRPVTEEFINEMANGIPILDTITRKCLVEQIHKKEFRITLTQGLNRQIRRMCEYLDYRVVKLRRVRIMNIKLDVGVGKYRDVTKKEFDELQNLIAESDKHID
jgi:23S rRNA pseudouridine2604 synthase